MNKLLKAFAIGIIAISCCLSVGCNNTVSTTATLDTDVVAENEVLVSGMNTYNEITNFGMGTANVISLNRDSKYIKGGDASAKIYFDRIAGPIMNQFRIGPNVTKFKVGEVESVSLQIYNANDYEVDFILAGRDTLDRAFFSKEVTLPANEWTDVSLQIDRYQIQLMNPTLTHFAFRYDTKGEKEATFYMDSFKVKLTDEAAKRQTKAEFAEGEILNFDVYSDVVWATPMKREVNGYGSTLATYDYLPYAPGSENEGALKIGVKRYNGLFARSETIWNGGYNLNHMTGCKVPTQLLSNIDLSGISALSIDVYHDYPNERRMTYMIVDELGRNATVSVWVQPYTWTTIKIEDFGIVDFTRITSIEFYYAEYMTFADYNIFIDNISYVKEA